MAVYGGYRRYDRRRSVPEPPPPHTHTHRQRPFYSHKAATPTPTPLLRPPKLSSYMMASPRNCHTTYLYPSGHPSGRHSEVDWSDPDLEKFPEFPKSTVSEVILTAGDFMYIPSGWMHYIMSMNVNWQCNARSGKGPTRGKQHLAKCGFHS